MSPEIKIISTKKPILFGRLGFLRRSCRGRQKQNADDAKRLKNSAKISVCPHLIAAELWLCGKRGWGGQLKVAADDYPKIHITL
jgi:hypothetical protein